MSAQGFFTPAIQIKTPQGNRLISESEKPFLIAEIGINHEGEPAFARELIDAAAEAGADAVKFQSYSTDHFLHPQKDKLKEIRDIFRKAELDAAAHQELKEYAEKKGPVFFSTPLDLPSLSMLNQLKLPLYKTASGDLLNFELNGALLTTGQPLIVSTGAHSLHDISRAASFYRAHEYRQVMFLHCVSLYPTPADKLNLARIDRIRDLTGALTGFSDHSEGSKAAAAAVAAGAVVIEKHFTIDRSRNAPDHAISAEPAVFREIRERIDEMQIMRSYREQPFDEESAGDYYGKRSLYESDCRLTAMRPHEESLPKPDMYLPETLKHLI